MLDAAGRNEERIETNGMVTDPEYPLEKRAETLVDSRLYCTRPA